MLEQIREILLLHNGKKNPITSAEIAKSLGIVEDDTHAQTRALILECAEKYELPLAANNRGYYLISDQQEYECFLLGKHTVERVCSGLSPLRRDRLWC